MGKGTKLLIFLLVVSIVYPATAWGDLRRFRPRIAEYSGELEIDMLYDRNENTVEGIGSKDSRTAVVERVNLDLNGYVYHPRFIIFLARVSGGLQQDRLSDGGEGSWSNSIRDRFEFRTKILPEHPYNLELFTIRNTFASRLFNRDSSPSYSQSGAILSYKKRPFTFNGSYTESTIESIGHTTDSSTYTMYGSFFLKNFYNSAGYTHTDSTSSFGSKNTRDYYYFENQTSRWKATLTSRVGAEKYDQEGSQSALRDHSFSWSEQLRLSLPWNFDTTFSLNRIKDTVRSRDESSQPFTTAYTNTGDKGFSVIHRLFRSLLTTFSLNDITVDSENGNFTTETKLLNVSYSKRIPGGTMYLAANLRHSDMRRTGAPDILSKTYSAPLGGSFTLAEQSVNEDTLSVRAVSVVEPPSLSTFIPLTKGIHYTVTEVGTFFVVTILSLPSLPPDQVCQISVCQSPFYEYSFQVSYSLLDEEVQLRTNGYGLSAKLSLFDNLVSPFYNYSRIRQKVEAGSLAGGPENSTSHAVGVVVQKPPYSLSLEYQEVISNINESKKFLAGADYRKNISDTASMYAKAFYFWNTYPSGTTEAEGAHLSEEVYGIDFGLQKNLPAKGISLSASGSYSHRNGTLRMDTYTFNSALTWKAGKLDLIMGLSESYSTGKSGSERLRTLSQSFYLNARRKLF